MTPLITILLLPRRPATILLAIITTYINTIKRVAFRRVPHVGNKVLKLRPPWIIYYPAVTIVLRVFHVWLIASPFHMQPCNMRSPFRITLVPIHNFRIAVFMVSSHARVNTPFVAEKSIVKVSVLASVMLDP